MNLQSAYLCPNVNERASLFEMLKPLSIAPAQIYESSGTISLIAGEIKRLDEREFFVIPFCHTIEAGALGADIRPADETAGPRPGKYVLSDVGELSLIRIGDDAKTQALLRACETLGDQSGDVVYEICGPISILSCLMDLSVFFRQWRKQPDKVLRAFELIKDMLLEFVVQICEAGASCISYADPAGNAGIMGPHYSKQILECFTLPFLHSAIDICSAYGVTLSLCPLAADPLKQYGALKYSEEDGEIAVACVGASRRLPKRHWRYTKPPHLDGGEDEI